MNRLYANFKHNWNEFDPTRPTAKGLSAFVLSIIAGVTAVLVAVGIVCVVFSLIFYLISISGTTVAVIAALVALYLIARKATQ